MSENKEGGYLFPGWVADELMRTAAAEIDWLSHFVLADLPPPPPLSRWQKLRRRYRWWRADLRERIHDWLFPEYRDNDW